MRTLLVVLILLFVSRGNSETLKVAVIDTGIKKYKVKDVKHPKKCNAGHKDFTGTGLYDFHGHGTNISYIISKYAGDTDYCIVSIKAFYKDNKNPLEASILALRHAYRIKADVIVYAGGGFEESSGEKKWIRKIIKENKSTVVAAAGNNKAGGIKLSKKDRPFYPACYFDEIIVVGNGKSNKERSETSNYGEVIDIWEPGEDVSDGVVSMSGTSQSTAIVTGKLIKQKGERNARQSVHGHSK